MASGAAMRACALGSAAGVGTGRGCDDHRRSSWWQLKSSSAILRGGGSAWRSMCSAWENSRACEERSAALVVRNAASKQKKKVREKRRSPSLDKQWKFDELMLVWDDVFERFCDSTSIASAVFSLSQKGSPRYGRGCVLMEESVQTRPRGAASGFSNKSRSLSPASSPELPFYTSLAWEAVYVPLEFIRDPLKAPAAADVLDVSPEESDGVRLVEQAKLIAMLRGMDRTRLVGLLSDPSLSTDNGADVGDAGGEASYDPSKDELVVMLAVSVDGQLAVGADVLKAFPAGVNDEGQGLWKLEMRDGVD